MIALPRYIQTITSWEPRRRIGVLLHEFVDYAGGQVIRVRLLRLDGRGLMLNPETWSARVWEPASPENEARLKEAE